MMNYDCAVKGENISKKFKTFTLDIPDLRVPKGFATALIGENGAGKTTLLNMLSGIRLDYKGELTFFDKYSSEEKERRADVKNRIGYTGTGRYYLPQWTVSDVEEISSLLFGKFSAISFCSLTILTGTSSKDIAENLRYFLIPRTVLL